MNIINFHIAYLLTNHECVTIPDFGAFVVSKKTNEKSNKRGFISPPASYFLTFNPEIIQDDGLLVRSVAKEKHIDYPEALRLVYDYVDSLVDTLREGQFVQFPWIGKIHLSDDRKIVFTPAKNLSCNASNCGLVNLNFPYLTEEPEDESAEKHKKIYKRPIFYVILAVIILLLAILFIFLGFFTNPFFQSAQEMLGRFFVQKRLDMPFLFVFKNIEKINENTCFFYIAKFFVDGGSKNAHTG